MEQKVAGVKPALFPCNISYSAYSLFKESPLQFYFQYIQKAKPTNVGVTAYGEAGVVIHKAIENYILHRKDTFDELWDKHNMEQLKGHNGIRLIKENYRRMFQEAKNRCDVILPGLAHQVEAKFEFLFEGTNIKGFMDLVFQFEKDTFIYDWKTNASFTTETHLEQRLFYSWIYYMVHGTIPRCTWVYLKTGACMESQFEPAELRAFGEKIKKFIQTINRFGNDINKYEAGNWKGPFNVYADLCAAEVRRREELQTKSLTFHIKGNFVFLEGDVDKILEDGLDYEMKFDEKDKFFRQQYAKKHFKGRNIKDIGTVHLYNHRARCFPIGYLPLAQQIVANYNSYYNKQITVCLKDSRDKAVMARTFYYQPSKSGKQIRPYQQEAIQLFLQKEFGIIQAATGAGKTFMAAQLIRETKAGMVLWIIDRKELVDQAKRELHAELGVPIGEISGGMTDVRQVTVATIQTLVSRRDELKDYLTHVNFLIIDEYHKAAAESYQRVCAFLANTRWRLGITATAYRDDGRTPILQSLIGDIIYTITTDELIKQGYLVKPTVQFYRLPGFASGSDYAADYQTSIVEYDIRNQKIVDLAIKNNDRKILILTKQVEHGAKLAEALQCAHIYGSLKAKSRKKEYDAFRLSDQPTTLVMTVSIGAEGLDIPNIDMIINAAANAGDVKTVQIIGRALRPSKGKTSALYVDFLDVGKYTADHSEARMAKFREQGYEVEVVNNG